MTKEIKWIALIVLILMLVAPLSSAFAGPKAPRFKTMTRNLYLGADIFKVADPDLNPALIPDVVEEVFNTMLYTNFWARAEAIADEIAYNDPEIIGLQEVSTFYIQTPGDTLILPPEQQQPATDVVINFYEVLNAALEARGLYYTAYITTNADVELPMTDGTSIFGFSDVRMVDHDIILVKANYPSNQIVLAPPYDTNNFDNNLEVEIAGSTVEFTRGFGIVDVDIKGTIFRFVNTHLEIRSAPGSPFRLFQYAQMMELMGILELLDIADSRPIIMVGDFNSSPEDIPGEYDPDGPGGIDPIPYVPPYMIATSAFFDTWLLQTNPTNKDLYDEGNTSGFEEEIDDPEDTLETRIDHIFLYPEDLEFRKSRCVVVGNHPSDMVENLPDNPGDYLWPSDHAGVVARLMFMRP
jgi:endonuclease/exonuclease/phosphatase family metal-dependent hydrolase